MKFKHIISVLLALIFAVTAFGCAAESTNIFPSVTPAAPDQSVMYTLYIGLADADTMKPIFSVVSAGEAVGKIFSEHKIGYTAYVADGAFVSDNDEFIENETLVYLIVGCSSDKVIELINEIKEKLHIASVFCTSASIGSRIYGGKIVES